MLAAAKTQPKAGIDLIDVPTPGPRPGEALVEVSFCGICGSDLPVYAWDRPPEKWAKALPRVMGHEFAGVIVDGGDARVPNGTLVAAEPGVGCGRCAHCRNGYLNLCPDRFIHGIDRDGAFARFVSVPLHSLWPMPPDLDPRRAAYLEIFALAVHALERAKLDPSDPVLIVGAGPIGIAIASICARPGAPAPLLIGTEADTEVRLPLARAVGAETCLAHELPEEARFGTVFEASGAPAGVMRAVAACETGGRIVPVGTTPGDIQFPWFDLVMRAIRVTPIRARLPRHWVKGGEMLGRMELPDGFFAEYPLSAIDEAFTAAAARQACKVLVNPA